MVNSTLMCSVWWNRSGQNETKQKIHFILWIFFDVSVFFFFSFIKNAKIHKGVRHKSLWIFWCLMCRFFFVTDWVIVMLWDNLQSKYRAYKGVCVENIVLKECVVNGSLQWSLTEIETNQYIHERCKWSHAYIYFSPLFLVLAIEYLIHTT